MRRQVGEDAPAGGLALNTPQAASGPQTQKTPSRATQRNAAPPGASQTGKLRAFRSYPTAYPPADQLHFTRADNLPYLHSRPPSALQSRTPPYSHSFCLSLQTDSLTFGLSHPRPFLLACSLSHTPTLRLASPLSLPRNQPGSHFPSRMPANSRASDLSTPPSHAPPFLRSGQILNRCLQRANSQPLVHITRLLHSLCPTRPTCGPRPLSPHHARSRNCCARCSARSDRNPLRAPASSSSLPA